MIRRRRNVVSCKLQVVFRDCLNHGSEEERNINRRKVGGSTKRITEDIAGKTSEINKASSGTKKKKVRASAGKTGTKAKKAGASSRRKKHEKEKTR